MTAPAANTNRAHQGECDEGNDAAGPTAAAALAAPRRTVVLQSTEFVTEHVDVSKTALLNQQKFNPILNDFDNIQFLLGETVQ